MNRVQMHTCIIFMERQAQSAEMGKELHIYLIVFTTKKTFSSSTLQMCNSLSALAFCACVFLRLAIKNLFYMANQYNIGPQLK